ncbi:hypothetical protein [Zoogloea sp.]|uniref:hypothetical protein n=1 Tax=Zoogloea sp. TaxID=49181 RepID=UPI0035AEDCA3
MKTTKGHSDTLISPIFSPGILLDAADLQQGVIYTQELMHLMMRHLFSPGVVCGLGIEGLAGNQGCPGKFTFTVQPGLALDACGRPIHVPNPIPIEISLTPTNTIYLIFIEYQEHASCCKEAQIKSDGTSNVVATRRSEGYEITIKVKGQENETGIKIGSIQIDHNGTPLVDSSKPTPITGKFALALSPVSAAQNNVSQSTGNQGTTSPTNDGTNTA